MVLPEDWSDWCRRFEGPVASWIESRLRRLAGRRSVRFSSPQTTPAGAYAA